MFTCDQLEEVNGDVVAEVRRDYHLTSPDCDVLKLLGEGWLKRHSCDNCVVLLDVLWKGLERKGFDGIGSEGRDVLIVDSKQGDVVREGLLGELHSQVGEVA